MVKINVYILSTDKVWCQQLGEYFMTFYEGKFSITVLDTAENLPDKLPKKRYVFLVDEEFAQSEGLSENVSQYSSYSPAFAYISNSRSSGDVNKQKTFCKYQKGSELYNCILNLYAVIGKEDTGPIKSGGIIVFSSAAGGAGATSCAVAFAKNKVRQGNKVLFLCFDYFEDNGQYFDSGNASDKGGGLSEFLYALASKRNSNITAETLLKKDSGGVVYVNCADEPSNLTEFTSAFIEKTIDAFAAVSNADLIVADVPYLNAEFWKVCAARADSIILITGVSKYAVRKTERMIKTVGIDDRINGASNADKLKIIKNKVTQSDGINEIGGAQVCGSISYFDVPDELRRISKMADADAWNAL